MQQKAHRECRLSIRVTAEEREHLEGLARTQNLTVASLVRRALREYRLAHRRAVPAVNRHLYLKLGRILESLEGARERPDWAQLEQLLRETQLLLLGIAPPEAGSDWQTGSGK